MTVPSIRLTGPASIIEAVPYLLGFTPADSLVLVGLRGANITVTARIDLNDLTRPDALTHLTTALADQAQSSSVLALTYGTPRDPDRIANAVAASGMQLLDHLRVANGRYWSLTCNEPQCCPTEGRPIPTDNTVAAEFVGLGASKTDSRSELAAIFTPADTASRLWPLIHTAEAATGDDRSHSDTQALLQAAERNSRLWTDEETAQLGVALTNLAVRDAAWLAVDAGHLDGRELFLHLAHHLPEHYRAAPLFLFGWKSWREGNGALASIAVEHALHADPTYSAADLLQVALARAIDPRRMPAIQLPNG
jgi:hypothetical protein